MGASRPAPDEWSRRSRVSSSSIAVRHAVVAMRPGQIYDGTIAPDLARASRPRTERRDIQQRGGGTSEMRLSLRLQSGGWSVVTARVTECHSKPVSRWRLLWKLASVVLRRRVRYLPVVRSRWLDMHGPASGVLICTPSGVRRQHQLCLPPARACRTRVRRSGGSPHQPVITKVPNIPFCACPGTGHRYS
jgi:hypothetical protein